MATSIPVAVSMAVKTVPEAPEKEEFSHEFEIKFSQVFFGFLTNDKSAPTLSDFLHFRVFLVGISHRDDSPKSVQNFFVGKLFLFRPGYGIIRFRTEFGLLILSELS